MLSHAADRDVTFSWQTADGTATAGSDYTAQSATSVTIPAGSTSATLEVQTTADTLNEADETFTVAISADNLPDDISLGATTATATIGSNGWLILSPGIGTLAFDSSTVSVTEGDKATFTVSLSKAATSDVTFSWSTTGGSAGGADYTAQAATSVSIAAGDASATLEVQTTQDTLGEANETFTVTITASSLPADVTLGTPTTATATIVDDDTPTVSLVLTPSSIGEGRGVSTVTATLSEALSQAVTLTVSSSPEWPALSADFTQSGTTLTIADGATTSTGAVTVTAVDNSVDAPNKHVTVSATATGGNGVSAPSSQVLTITDDDSAAVTIADASASEGDAISFTVTLDKAVAGGLKVTPSFTDGTATKGTDYTENTTVLTFAGTAGETQSFTVATTEDTTVETDETFTVGLTVSGTQATYTASDTATGTINDDDSAAVTVADVSAAEGDSMTFTVTLDKAVAGGLKVTPSFTDGTATKGTDYTENTSALTFAGTAGETQSFTVATTEDTTVETNETFTVGLAVSGTAASVTATDTATGTITNDDGSAAVTVDDASANEGDSITFTVTLNKAVAGGLKVTPSFTDGTATKGTDYTENTTALTFAGTAGEKKTFTVATTEDTTVENQRDLHRRPGGVGDLRERDRHRHGHRHHHQRRRKRRGDHRRRLRQRGRLHQLHGDPGQGGGRRVEGHSLLHRRDSDKGHRLHREHDSPHLRRHRGRDTELHGGDQRRHNGRDQRDLHRRPGGVGDVRKRDRDRHGHRHDHQRRRQRGRDRG